VQGILSVGVVALDGSAWGEHEAIAEEYAQATLGGNLHIGGAVDIGLQDA
jgi:hypothetical protein